MFICVISIIYSSIYFNIFNNSTIYKYIKMISVFFKMLGLDTKPVTSKSSEAHFISNILLETLSPYIS